MVRIAATVEADTSARDRVDAEHDRHVVQQRAHDRDRESPLVAQAHVQRDQSERDDDRVDRALQDLPAEARGDILDRSDARVDLIGEAGGQL
jgi:hypothetical protein